MKLRLFSKLMLLVMLPVFIILMALSGFTSLTAERIMRKQIDADMTLVLAQQAQEYRSFYKNMADVAVTLSRRDEIVAALAQHHPEAAAEEVSGILEQYPLVKRMELLDADGKELYAKGSMQLFADYNKSGFLGQLQNGPASSVFQKPNTQDLVLVFGAPVRGSQKLLGYVLFSFPLNELGQAYSDRIRVGASGKIFVLDSKGVVLLDPTDKGSIAENISSIDWIRTMLTTPKGTIRYEWSGIAKSCYYERVEGLNWTLGLGFTDADLLGPLVTIRNEALLVSLGAVVLLTLIVFGIARSVAVPLRSTVAFLREVGDGHMQVSSQIAEEQSRSCLRHDEIGDLARGCRAMHRHLIDILGNAESSANNANEAAENAKVATARAEEALIQAKVARQEATLAVASQLEGITETLSVAASALSERIEQSGNGSVEQASRVSQTATAMEEMNVTVHEVAKNASAASSVSANTRSKAEEGAVVVGQALASIKDVQRRSLALKEDMAALGEYAGSISQIMGVISDIADQTNLLALNAAIEAARAGEAGRGFAVVADEVRKLAEKTMTSTTDVGNAIRAIQQSADKNIAQVDQAVDLIAGATELSSRSGEALQEIVRMVDDTADQVRAIASASEQQSATSSEINQSIELVNAIASETATSMQEAEREVQNLTTQAHELQRLIENLKRSQGNAD